MPDFITAPAVRSMRAKGVKVVCITAYDAVFGAMADAAGADIVLVGDSVGNTALGYPSTLPVSLEEMLHHTRATRQGVRRALLVADLPFGSYQASVEQAVSASIALVKAGAQAVKLEGRYTEAIAEIIRAGIPVMGHVGMTPQSLNIYGGFRVQGKGESGQAVIDAAKQVENAGAFSIVLELIPAHLASVITDDLHIPTIGIGAGAHCSGQVQVIYDVLGLTQGPLKHAKGYISGYECFVNAIKDYAAEVREGVFPSEENSF
jgi:3-methyl-2-oxobutanoate hydroxymethyltransferase